MRDLAIGEAAKDLQGYAAYFSAGAGIGLGGTIHSATGFKFVDGAKIPTLTLDTAGEFFSPYLAMGNNWITTVDPDGRCTTCPDNSEVGATHYDIFSEQTYTMTKNGWGTDGGAVGGLSTVFLTNKTQPTISQGSALKTNENGPWNFRWGNSDNSLASLSYNIANDAFQVVQTFDFDLIPSGGTNPLTGGKTNLNIDGSPNYKPVDGFVNTVSTLIPVGRGVQGLKSAAPKGLGYLEKLNAAQFSQTFKGNFARLAPATRGKLNIALNMGVNYINNQVANGMMLLHSLKFKSQE